MRKRIFVLFSFFIVNVAFCNWSTTSPFKTDEECLSPVIKMNSNGYCVRVWGHLFIPSSFYESLQAGISKDYGETWTIEDIDQSNYSQLGINPFLVLNDSNQAIIAWQRWDYSSELDKNIYQVKITPYGVTPLLVTTLDENSSDDSHNPPKPVVGLDDSGNAIALWNWKNQSNDKYYPKKAWSSDGGVTWQGINFFEDIIPMPSDSDINIQLAMDKASTGKAVAVWMVHTSGVGYFTRVARTDDFGKTWKDLQNLDKTPSTEVVNNEDEEEVPVVIEPPEIELDEKGNVEVDWIHNDNGEEYTNKAYSPDYGQSWPINISCIKQEIHSFLQVQLRNKIIVNAINQRGTFKIYKDSALTKLMDSKCRNNEYAIFYDYNVKKGPCTYYITWVSQSGIVTGPVEFTIND